MKKLSIVLSICLLFISLSTQAVTKRALFMAIDTYNPSGQESTGARHWTNLEGCVNDAEQVKTLVAAKYGFTDNKYITFIKNQECTRDRILAELNKLIDQSQKGDVVFIYYAGHGSQVVNSLSEEADKLDETMVPADVWKGAKDIRDKELALLFNKLIEKGVVLTVIYDSCHSGSVGRGPLDKNKAKERKIEPDVEDVRDATHIAVAPEQRGALVLSAAQDNECASEQIDDNKIPHGAFTIALCKALQSLPATASADEIFASIRAIMKYNGKTQEPVMAGNDERIKNTLFGMDRGTLKNKTMVAILNPEDKASIQIQGGWALGIAKGCILENVDHTIKIEITNVNDVTKSTGNLISGDASKIKAGDLYTVERWATTENSLRVYIPAGNITYEKVLAAAQEFAKLETEPKVKMVTDPAAESPSHTLFYNEGWYIGTPDGKSYSLGMDPKVADIKKYFKENTIKLFVSLPAYNTLRTQLYDAYKENTAVQPVEHSNDANYILVGRYFGGQVQYSYTIPGINNNDTNYTSTMPVRTDFIAMAQGKDKESIDSLVDYSLRLSKIKAWLALSSPADGQGNFPFYLGLRNSATKEVVTGGNVKEGDTYGLVLLLDKKNSEFWDGQKRYIYVFALDNKGNTTLYYPLGGSVENRMPRMTDDNKVQEVIPLGQQPLFKVTDPNTMDTYILLSTDEPITNPKVLESKGVKTRDASRGSWVSQLMNVGASTRGDLLTPSNWSIQRVSVRCVAK